MVSRIIKYVISIVFITGLISTKSNAQKLPEGYVVIANEIGKKQIDQKELIEIFRGKYNSWNNNEQTVIILPSSKHVNVDIIAKNIFQGNKDAMMKYWLSLVFQGRANPPVFLENDKEIIEYVESTPGSIAIIKSSSSNQHSKLILKIVE